MMSREARFIKDQCIQRKSLKNILNKFMERQESGETNLMAANVRNRLVEINYMNIKSLL